MNFIFMKSALWMLRDLKVSSFKVKRKDGELCGLRLVRTENIYGYSTMVRERCILCSNIADEPFSVGNEEFFDVVFNIIFISMRSFILAQHDF